MKILWGIYDLVSYMYSLKFLVNLQFEINARSLSVEKDLLDKHSRLYKIP